MHDQTELMLSALLTGLGEDPRLTQHVRWSGRRDALPAAFAVGALAAASSAAACLGVAALQAARAREALRAVNVDHVHAAAAFRSERYVRGEGFTIPAPWDPIAGDYEARDGFIRLHTNYAWHRDAALRVLGVPAEPARVTDAVGRWHKQELEAAVIAAGGAAAAMHTEEEFARSDVAEALRAEPLVLRGDAGAAMPLAEGRAPLAGVRVLDLTRVIAGPVCTRFLGAWGADVLRIDPPGFAEVPALLCETTWGKRRAALALRDAGDRARLERLLAEADVLVVGYRPTALEALDLAPAAVRARHPGLVIVQLDAYGYDNPWAGRRGFDSLVQMSVGIAARGGLVAGSARPRPLPAQALDHGTGYLAAAAASFGLATRARHGRATTARLSLARVAWLLLGHGHAPSDGALITEEEATRFVERAASDYGPTWRVRVPGAIGGLSPVSTVPAGPLGAHPAAFSPR